MGDDGGYDGSGGGYGDTNDSFGNGNSGYETGSSSFGWNNDESTTATDKTPSTNLERSCDKDDEQASHGDIRRESADSAVDDVMNTNPENNNDEDERDRSAEEENLSRREEDRPYPDLNEHNMNSDLLECLFCCVIA